MERELQFVIILQDFSNMQTKKDEINVQLTTEEANTVLEALGNLPFVRVYKIIEKIHLQAAANQKKNNPSENTDDK